MVQPAFQTLWTDLGPEVEPELQEDPEGAEASLRRWAYEEVQDLIMESGVWQT
jgi:hypothetical protein